MKSNTFRIVREKVADAIVHKIDREIMGMEDRYIRCIGCGKVLASDLEGKVTIICNRCKRRNKFENKKVEENNVGYKSCNK